MKKIQRVLSYILVAVMASCLTLVLFGGGGEAQGKLDRLERLIQTRFIDEYNMAELEDAAAEAMVEALGDRWSYYMNAQEYQAYQESMANAYVGIGITITTLEDGYFQVMKVEAGGSAEEAGMQVGDIITQVNAQDIGQMDVDAVKDMVRGKEGTQVQITVKRSDGEHALTVTRRKIQTVVATGEMLPGNIGLVSIVNFDSRCADETIAHIDSLVDQGAHALIFDVRYNPGGYQHELVEILDYLLPEGPLFRSVDYSGKESVDQSDDHCLNLPMAVLMNGDSYSAAEFFAAALKEYDAAILVGQPTTGKGHFQSAYELGDGSAVVISIGKYVTPKGVSLDRVGLTPDVLVDVDEETYWSIYYGTLGAAEDPQIQAAVAALNRK